jgi:enamine deaminase RidA (YjgF/YER057c/UK114 family)
MKRPLLTIAVCFGILAATTHAQGTEYKNPDGLGKPNGYTHVVIVNRGKLILISGQTGMDSKGEMAGKDDFAAQAKQAFANLRTALAAAGAAPKDVVKLNYYVVGLNHDKLLALRTARDSFIDRQHPPASTLAGVQALFREDALVEIEAEAVVP